MARWNPWALYECSNQSVGRLESSAAQAKWQYRLHDLQLFRWINAQIYFGGTDISVPEPQCHLEDVPSCLEQGGKVHPGGSCFQA
jgi:hypothetical protein